MFNWQCPDCNTDHFYAGSLTTRATTNCPKSKKKYKVWQFKVVVEEPKNKMLEISLDRLREPKVETSFFTGNAVRDASEKNKGSLPDDSKALAIDFSHLANSSDFKRLLYLAITGQVWRGTNKGLDMSLKALLRRLKKK